MPRGGCCCDRSEFSDVICLFPDAEVDPKIEKVPPWPTVNCAVSSCLLPFQLIVDGKRCVFCTAGDFTDQNTCEEHGCCWTKTLEDKRPSVPERPSFAARNITRSANQERRTTVVSTTRPTHFCGTDVVVACSCRPGITRRDVADGGR